jgi:elongator complex protein 3
MEKTPYDEIASVILDEGCDAQRAKLRISGKYSLKHVPSNAEVLNNVSPEKRELLRQTLKKKPIRTLSGVAVVAVMTSPAPCPHGRCLYCPTGIDSPQSYTGFEPAALRAKRSDYDPFSQVADRLNQLHTIGHDVEKAELIVMGGTFPARDEGYRKWFLKRSLDAMNSFGGSHEIGAGAIDEAQKINETARVRNVGITFETRPDFAREEHVDMILKLGGTRIEMGVQTLKEEVYKKMNRGHTLEDVVSSTRIVKDAGLKVGYHMMPGLFSNYAEEIEMFRELFSSSDFKPDMLKIYPTLVLKGTGLYKMWEKSEFIPMDQEETIGLIVEVKKRLPKWIRTMRIQRDIPAGLIEAGVKKGNLGELVQERLEESGVRCRCIRCRDAGHLDYKEGVKSSELEILVESYEASMGREIFVSMEDISNDVIAGYLRLRFPSHTAHRHEVDETTALVRELKVLGRALRIGERDSGGKQHMGIGRSLLERCEDISRDAGRKRLLVTSAIGTREYYRKSGFMRIGPYMGKDL